MSSYLNHDWFESGSHQSFSKPLHQVGLHYLLDISNKKWVVEKSEIDKKLLWFQYFQLKHLIDLIGIKTWHSKPLSEFQHISKEGMDIKMGLLAKIYRIVVTYNISKLNIYQRA